MKRKIAIIGAGGFGREVKMLIDQINEVGYQYEFIGYYDDAKKIGEHINGFPILGTINDLNNLDEHISIAVAIGNPINKIKIISSLKNPKLTFETLIHPSVLIGNDDVSIGKGCIICAGNIITCNIKIKDFVIINLSCTIGHDTEIENYVSLMPGVNVSGEVILKECVYIGTGTKIINQLEIGENTIVGAGAIVANSLPKNCTAVGIPAKPIKFHS